MGQFTARCAVLFVLLQSMGPWLLLPTLMWRELGLHMFIPSPLRLVTMTSDVQQSQCLSISTALMTTHFSVISIWFGELKWVYRAKNSEWVKSKGIAIIIGSTKHPVNHHIDFCPVSYVDPQKWSLKAKLTGHERKLLKMYFGVIDLPWNPGSITELVISGNLLKPFDL